MKNKKSTILFIVFSIIIFICHRFYQTIVFVSSKHNVNIVIPRYKPLMTYCSYKCTARYRIRYIIFSTNRILLKKNTYEGVQWAPSYVFLSKTLFLIKLQETRISDYYILHIKKQSLCHFIYKFKISDDNLQNICKLNIPNAPKITCNKFAY